jgi:splicing factor 1
VEKAQKLNPMFRSPSDWSKGQTTKKQRKLYIPVDKYPNYNFIGLIIGPRGITQKKLEKETGAKISIRGKGSEKEGKAQKNQEGMDEPLHVLITGDTDEAVEAASVVISKLLVPVDDTKNEHKRAQLRTLAEMNGTVSQSQAWRNNPDLNPQLQTGVQVQCALCGEVSHPTKDCPLKNQAGVRSRLDSELERFFEEVGEKRPSDSASATASADADADAAYAAFMSEVSGVASQPARPAAAAPTPSATAASSSAPPASAAAAAAAPPPWQQQTQQAQQARPPAPPAAAAPPPWQQAPWQQQQQQQGAYAAPWMAPMPGYPYAGVPMPPMPGYPLMPGMYAPPMQPMQPMQGQMPARPGLLPTPPAGARPT